MKSRLDIRRGESNKKIIIGAVVLFILILLLPALLFLSLPASIFSESSDLTHDERDEKIMSETSENGQNFTVSGDGFVKALNIYKNSLLGKLSKPPDSEYVSEENQNARATITQDEFELIAAIVEAESGESEEGARAVISCVLNRIMEGSWDKTWDREKHLSGSSGGSDPLSILTADGQFEAYNNYSYLRHLNSTSEEVKKAVFEVLTTGKTSHDYTCFRSYETAGSVKIGGNYFFSPLRVPKETIIYNISGEKPEGVASPETGEGDFVNPDPNGKDSWDLLYLICAYDVSKNNLEGKDRSPDSRFTDLTVNLIDYIVKAVFGTEIETSEEQVIPARVPVHEEMTINVLVNGKITPTSVYIKTGEEESSEEVEVETYQSCGSLKVVENPPDLNGTTFLREEGDTFVFSSPSGEIKVPFKIQESCFVKTGGKETLKPETVTVTKKERVYGLAKSVLLAVFGLSPTEPYSILSDINVTNSDMIEYMRSLMIKVLNISVDDYSIFSSSPVISGSSASGWLWPLDPNGAGAFVITSLMGTRESPGGIGSTDHGGTDIGAAYGVAILATRDGVVDIAGPYGGYGNCVRINHGNLTDGAYESLYGHMSVIAVSAGETVKQGQIIGYVGSTGWSTGPHLHFEVHKNGERINSLSIFGEDIFSRLTYNL